MADKNLFGYQDINPRARVGVVRRKQPRCRWRCAQRSERFRARVGLDDDYEYKLVPGTKKLTWTQAPTASSGAARLPLASYHAEAERDCRQSRRRTQDRLGRAAAERDEPQQIRPPSGCGRTGPTCSACTPTFSDQRPPQQRPPVLGSVRPQNSSQRYALLHTYTEEEDGVTCGTRNCYGLLVDVTTARPTNPRCISRRRVKPADALAPGRLERGRDGRGQVRQADPQPAAHLLDEHSTYKSLGLSLVSWSPAEVGPSGAWWCRGGAAAATTA